MRPIRLFMSALFIGISVLSAEEFLQTPLFPENELHQQIFFFGGVDGAGVFAEELMVPDVGLLYRRQNGIQGYDVAVNRSRYLQGTELTLTYNLYAPTKIIQPYIGAGGGIVGRYSDREILGVVPLVIGVNSPILFADVGIATYLGTYGELKHCPWLVAVKPQARIGIGYQF